MFEIEYKGANCVVIGNKDKKIVIDPNISQFGLKNVSLKGVVELATESRFAIDNDDLLLKIDSPGEYEVANSYIKGIPAKRHIDEDGKLSTIYRIELGLSRICIVGNIDKELSDEQLEGIGVIDVLVLPVGGGGYTLDAVDAARVVRSIDPKVVIPIHYDDDSVKYEVPQDSLDLFVKELGVPSETVAKYKQKLNSSIESPLTIVNVSITR